MQSWRPWGVALAGCLATILPARAQVLPNAPTYKYPITPEAGAWMICVNSYRDSIRGPKAQDLAEELAEYIRSEYKLPAYLFNWGRKQREAEDQRIAELRKQNEEFIKSMGISREAAGPFRVKTYDKMPDEFAVLVGGWKDMETARKALDRVRKLQPPPEKLVDKVIQADNKEGISSPSNPFMTAMVVPNPTVPKPKPEEDKEDATLLKRLNAGNKYSVLHCRKDWTLVVKVFYGTTQVQAPSGGGLLRRLGLAGDRTGEVLNAGALQAESLAGVLRDERMKLNLDSYVLHTRHSSVVCVGEFDSPDDPKMRETMLTLSKIQELRLSGTADSAAQQFLQLNPQPLPMKIPRP